MLRVLGFSTLACGCAVGHYREVATRREITYVEAKGPNCESQQHRRNHTVPAERRSAGVVVAPVRHAEPAGA